MKDHVKTQAQFISELTQLRERITELEALESERKWAEEQIRYQATLVDNVSDAIIATDLNFRITSWNHAAETIYGWQADEVIGKPAQEILSIAYLPGQREEIVRQFDEQGSWKGELPQKRKDGTTLSIYSSITLLKDSAGQPMGAVAINRDTTDRKQAEERIAWLASFPERNPNPVVEVDPAGHVRYCNPAAQRLLPDLATEGFQHPWIAGLEAIAAQFQKGEKVSAVRDVALGEGWYQQTLYYIPETGGMRIYSIDITARKQAEEEIQQLNEDLEYRVIERTVQLESANRALQDEIVEREQIEEHLRASEEHFRALTENSPDVIARYDRALRYLYVSPAISRYVKLTPQDYLGKTNRELGFPENLNRLWEEVIQKVFATGAPQRSEFAFEGLHGQTVFDFHLVPEYDARGQVQTVLSTARDITARKQMENALQESEARYRELFETSRDGIVSTDLQGQYLDCNRAYLELLGYTLDDLRTKSYKDVTPPEYYALEARIITEQTLRQGYSEEYEKEYIRATGERVPVSLRLWLRYDNQPQPTGVWAIVRDITERKQAEAELRNYREHLEELVQKRTARLEKEINERRQVEEELRVSQAELEQQNEELRVMQAELIASYEKYNDLYDFAPVGYCTVDQNGRITEANLTAATLFGVERGQLLQARLYQFILDVDRDRLYLHLRQLVQTRTRQTCEVRLVRPDGVQFFVQLDSIVAEDHHDPEDLYRTAISDITEHKRAEEALITKSMAIESSINAIAMSDLAGNLTYINPAFLKLWGYDDAQEVLGKNVIDFWQIIEEPRKVIEALQTKGGWQGELIAQKRDGSAFDAEISASMVFDQKHQPLCMLGAFVDITARKQAEAELQQAKNAADAANRAKSEFLANISHELRTPLNAILGFAQILERDPTLSAKQQKNLAIIIRSGEHLLNLINDVLELSKIEAGQNTLVTTTVDLHHLLDDLEMMVRFRAEKKGLDLVFERAPEVPQYIITDERKLRQILLNLLGNAVKFTERGSVTLRVNIDDLVETGRRPVSTARLIFEIADTGPGVAPEEIDQIFQAFTQTQSGQRSQEGTGLGLTISRQFVRLMGGELTVNSQVGVGSSFTFDIPLELSETPKILSQRLPPRQVIGLEPSQPAYRILIADDNQESRALLRELLEPVGFDVQEATNGEDVVALGASWRPHLIWMDMRMPILDGYEATKRIKATAQGRATVIIAVTASAFEEDRVGVLTAGCDDFVRKPFLAAEIFDMLHKHIGVRYVYAQLKDSPLPPQTVAADLTPAALATLPAELLTSLEQAALRTNITLLFSIIEQIRPSHAGLAEALGQLVDNFDYEQMLTVIQQAKEKP